MYFFKAVIVGLMVLNSVEFVLCQESEKIPKTIGTVTAQPATTIPNELAVPKGNNFAFLLNAKGIQRYKCIAPAPGSGSWSSGDSEAVLINDKTDTGQNFDPAFEVVHFNISPTPNNGGNYTWKAELPSDNSTVVGKSEVSFNSTDATNIPWERVAATFRDGNGRLGNISYILKVNTNGGIAPPADQCGIQYPNDFIQNVTFSADYWFYEGPLPGTEKPTTTQPSSSPTAKSASHGHSIKFLHSQTPLLSILIGPGQLGWVAIVSFVFIGVTFF